MSAKPSPHVKADRILAGTVACVVSACLGSRAPDGFVWPKAIFRATRGDPIEAFARQVTVFLLVTRFELTTQRAAEAIGRDRTTASHARDVVANAAIDDDTDGFSAWLEEVGALADRAWKLRAAQVHFEREAMGVAA